MPTSDREHRIRWHRQSAVPTARAESTNRLVWNSYRRPLTHPLPHSLSHSLSHSLPHPLAQPLAQPLAILNMQQQIGLLTVLYRPTAVSVSGMRYALSGKIGKACKRMRVIPYVRIRHAIFRAAANGCVGGKLNRSI